MQHFFGKILKIFHKTINSTDKQEILRSNTKLSTPWVWWPRRKNHRGIFLTRCYTICSISESLLLMSMIRGFSARCEGGELAQICANLARSRAAYQNCIIASSIRFRPAHCPIVCKYAILLLGRNGTTITLPYTIAFEAPQRAFLLFVNYALQFATSLHFCIYETHRARTLRIAHSVNMVFWYSYTLILWYSALTAHNTTTYNLIMDSFMNGMKYAIILLWIFECGTRKP